MHYLLTAPQYSTLVVDNPIRNEYRRRRRQNALSARLGVMELPDPSAPPGSEASVAGILNSGACGRCRACIG